MQGASGLTEITKSAIQAGTGPNEAGLRADETKMIKTINNLRPAPASSRHYGAALWLAAVFSILALAMSGCETSPALPSSVPTPSMDAAIAGSETNLLQQGDVVSISFEVSSNYSTTQKISYDGTLNLEGVGSVKCSGKTPLQLQAELVKLYEPLAKDDLLTVKLISTAACVYVSGAVIRPGKVPLERAMTVLEAIMEADGFDSNRAQLTGVTVLRLEDGRQKIYHVNVRNLLEGREDSPFYLKPFDIVHVPAKTFNF
jgi:protein involved in polysaccharide export with SLBB domain